jgi:hypothetical protein
MQLLPCDVSLTPVFIGEQDIAHNYLYWISVVDSLALRGLVDAPPNEILQTLSITVLIAEVKHAVVGPRTWSCTSEDPPTVARQCAVPVHAVDPDAVWLLPGGRHIAMYTKCGVRHDRGIQCWDLFTGGQVWQWAREGFSRRRYFTGVGDVRWAWSPFSEMCLCFALIRFLLALIDPII